MGAVRIQSLPNHETRFVQRGQIKKRIDTLGRRSSTAPPPPLADLVLNPTPPGQNFSLAT